MWSEQTKAKVEGSKNMNVKKLREQCETLMDTINNGGTWQDGARKAGWSVNIGNPSAAKNYIRKRLALCGMPVPECLQKQKPSVVFGRKIAPAESTPEPVEVDELSEELEEITPEAVEVDELSEELEEITPEPVEVPEVVEEKSTQAPVENNPAPKILSELIDYSSNIASNRYTKEALHDLNTAIDALYNLDVGALSRIPEASDSLRTQIGLPDFADIAERLDIFRRNLFSHMINWNLVEQLMEDDIDD